MGGVLVILLLVTSTVNAKTFPQNLTSVSTNDDLSERLAADKDFQEFLFIMDDFTDKVITTKSQRLLINYLEHKNSIEETNALLKNLEFKSQKEFNQYWLRADQLNSSIKLKFSELSNRADIKEVIVIAAQKVADEKLFSKKSPGTLCWLAFLGQSFACSTIVCNGAVDYQDCLGTCTMMAMMGYMGCIFWTD